MCEPSLGWVPEFHFPHGHSQAVNSSGELPLTFSIDVAPGYQPELLWEQES